MNEQQPRTIFGLNFLQDMKGVSTEITGAYDPEQELWSMQGPVQGNLPPIGGSSKILGQLSDHFHKPSLSTRQPTNTTTYHQTSIGAGSHHDYDENTDRESDSYPD